MNIKNSLSIRSTPDETHLIYMENICEYTFKKSKTKKIYTKEFH